MLTGASFEFVSVHIDGPSSSLSVSILVGSMFIANCSLLTRVVVVGRCGRMPGGRRNRRELGGGAS